MDEEDLSALRHAIRAFVVEHGARPFGVLREVGVQAALKRLTDAALGHRATVDAFLCDEAGRLLNLPPVNTDRVRLEARIQLPGDPPEGAADGVPEASRPQAADQRPRTDLLIHRRDNVALTRHRNGPGDVVYRTTLDSVLAVVEIKADPSHTTEQKRGYARDLQRLLKLRAAGVSAAHFVVLDKSSPFYGDFHDRRQPFNCIAWNPNPGQPTALTAIVPPAIADEGWSDIYVADVPPETPAHFVEIWNVATTDQTQQRFFAFRKSALGRGPANFIEA